MPNIRQYQHETIPVKVISAGSHTNECDKSGRTYQYYWGVWRVGIFYTFAYLIEKNKLLINKESYKHLCRSSDKVNYQLLSYPTVHANTAK